MSSGFSKIEYDRLPIRISLREKNTKKHSYNTHTQNNIRMLFSSFWTGNKRQKPFKYIIIIGYILAIISYKTQLLDLKDLLF